MRQLLDKLACYIQSGQQAGIDKVIKEIQLIYTKKPGPASFATPFPPLSPPPTDLVLVNENEDEWAQEDLNKEMNAATEEIAQLDEDAQGGNSRDKGKGTSSSKDTSSSKNTSSSMGKSKVTSNTTRPGEPTNEKKKESNRQTLRRLQALIKVLLESPSSKEQFDRDHVRESVF
jgi:hypothetical protein